METNVKLIIQKFLHSVKSAVMAMDVETLKEGTLQEVYEGVKEITSLVTPPAPPTPEVKPDFEPIGWDISDISSFDDLINKSFILNNGKTLDDILIGRNNYFTAYSQDGWSIYSPGGYVMLAVQQQDGSYKFSMATGLDGSVAIAIKL